MDDLPWMVGSAGSLLLFFERAERKGVRVPATTSTSHTDSLIVSIYTTSPIKPNERQSPLFVDKDLKGLTASKLSESGVFASYDKGYEQVAYSSYKANIAAFLHATTVNKKTIVGAGAYPLSIPPPLLAEVQYPPVAFRLKSRKPDDSDAIKAKYSPRIREVAHGKQPVLVFVDYEVAELMEISSRVDTETRGPVGTTSINGLRSFMTAVKILTAFLRTHTYPAFKGDFDKNVSEYNLRGGNVELDVSTMHECPLANHESGEGEMDIDDLGIAGLGGSSTTVYRDYRSSLLVSAQQSISTAKPSPLPYTYNYGPTSRVSADLPGLVFPYFDGLLIPDPHHLISIIQHYFYRNFGESLAACHVNFINWRRCVSEWIRTDAGMAISHIFFGVKLALESQTRLYVVDEDSTYNGFVLLGSNFFVSAQSKIHHPKGPTELAGELRAMSAHQVALEKIAALLSEQPLEEHKNTEEVESSGLQSGRAVLREIWRRVEFDGDKLKELKGHVAQLHFTSPDYLSPTIDNQKKLISAISASNADLFADDAIFINPGRLYVQDPRYICLAAFGPTAPSYVNNQGVTFSIPAPDEEDSASSVVDPKTGKKSLNVMMMTMKPLEVAFDDWKWIDKECAIKVNQMERAAASRVYVYQDVARDNLWNHFKDTYGLARQVRNGKKRSREESDEENDENKGAKRTKKADSAFNLLDF